MQTGREETPRGIIKSFEKLGGSSCSKWPVRHKIFALAARLRDLTCGRVFIIHYQLSNRKPAPYTGFPTLPNCNAFWAGKEQSGSLCLTPQQLKARLRRS